MAKNKKAWRVDEPPGGHFPRSALLHLTDPKLSDAFERDSVAYYDVWPEVGYRQPTRRGRRRRDKFDLRPERALSVAERTAIAQATRHPAFRLARQEHLASGWAVVRYLLSRLAAGEIVAFGTPTAEGETVRFELHPSVWVGASLVDFPFRGLNWRIWADDTQFGHLKFHRGDTLDKWRTGIEINRGLEVLFPTDFATYRVAKKQQREAARTDPEELEFEPMDHDFLHWDLAETFARGGFELLVLYPPGPDAEYRSVSSVQATSHSLIEIDIVESRIKLPGCDWLPGLVRFVGTLDPEEGASSLAPKGSQSTAADETQVRAYLFEVAAAGPPVMVKEQRWADVKKRWSKVSRRAFDRAWAAVANKYPEWRKAGRRKSKQRAN